MKVLKVGNVDVLLDDWDWLCLCRKKWRVKKVNHYQSYIVRTEKRNGKSFTIYMHREVMNFPIGMEVHHKLPGNTFDNRKENLEVMTKEEHGEKHGKKYEANK